MTNSILVVGPSWIGDLVMAQSLFLALEYNDRQAKIDVIAPQWSLPILQRMPVVHQAIPLPIGHGSIKIGLRRKIGTELRQRHYNQAIVLPNSFKSALIPWFANIPIRTGWLGECRFGILNDARKLDKVAFPLMVDRFVALAFPASIKSAEHLPTRPPPRLVSDQAASAVLRNQHHLNCQNPVLAICPGAEFGQAKRWPEQHFAKVAHQFIDKGWQVWLFGSESDLSTCTTLRTSLNASQQQACVNLAGKTTLPQAIDLLAAADIVLSNDSGLMHIAAALEKPLVVLYGSSSPNFTPPLNKHHRILSTALPCQPCFQRVCRFNHYQCLIQLEPTWVIQAIEELYQNRI